MADNSNEEINAINSLFPGNNKRLYGIQTKLVYLMLKLSFKFSILIIHYIVVPLLDVALKMFGI